MHRDFIAKTQKLSCDSKPFFIPNLEPLSGRDSSDRLLCPVRMLKFLSFFTGGTAEDIHSFKKCAGKGVISSKAILSWLRNLIIYIYIYDTDTSITPRGHEVRKMATSWALHKNCNIHDILLSASWASTTTFTSHYLVDIKKTA